jgi:hypothetical protein
MFSVVFPGGGEHQANEMPGHAQCTLMGTVVIDGQLFGRTCGALGAGYNPFELYGAAGQGRGRPLPPHLVFAELSDGDESACAFLNAYGPLRRPSQVGPWDELPEQDAKRWKEKVKKSPVPEVFFPDQCGIAPLLPPSLTPQWSYIRTPLEEFWRDQNEFELTLRLYAALHSGRPNRFTKIKQVLAMFDVKWKIEGNNVERKYIRKAIDYVRDGMNDKLKFDVPRVIRALDGSTVEGIWGCYSLLEAMYLMLFLDIASRNARILQCEKCSRLFYSGRERGKYCSTTCENRARALRSYYKKKGGSADVGL